MNFLFDFFPIVLFFVAYKLYGLYIATIMAIIATFVQVSIFWLKNRRFEKMHIITLAIIVVFGGATLLLENPEYIQWKTTLVNWIFAIVLFASQFIGKKNLIQRMLQKQLPDAPDSLWKQLNISWALFFLVMGFINLYIMYTQSLDTWVNFKFFGVLGLTLIFVIIQALFLSKHISQPDTDENN